MTYRAEVHWAPADELVISLKAYAWRTDHATLDLGAAWAKEVRRTLTPDLAQRLSPARAIDDMSLLDLLIRYAPARSSVDAFLTWVADLPLGQIYEWLAPLAPPKSSPALTALGALRDDYVALLRDWNEQYFAGIDPAILDGLAADAAEKEALAATMAPAELVELATSGVAVSPEVDYDTIWLVPQYHYRPWNVSSFHRGGRCIYYPADVLPLPPDAISPRLRRLTKALSDESRLRILRFLAAGPAAFMDVVALTGLSKSTVNHHMVVLRAAGLVRVLDAGKPSTTYTLRPEAIDVLTDDLRSYLTSAPTGGNGGR